MNQITASRNKRSRPRGYADWTPRAHTAALLQQVEEVLEEYVDHLPLTVRQIFYRLVANYGYEKSERAYARLAEMLVRARRAKRIPFEYVRDDGVVTAFSTWHDGAEDFWDDVGHRINDYRRDRQAGQPQRIELWCESAGMLHQLARASDPYSVPVYSAGGFASLTATRQIAARACDQPCATVLLHVGDCDPSGESIFDAMAQDAAAFVDADRLIGTQRVTAIRVALTLDQVEDFGLPTAPAKKTDLRSKSWEGETCQLEALAPDQLAEVVTSAIEGLLEDGPLAQQLSYEKADRVALQRALPHGVEGG